jgi:hypothetical protein
MLNINQPCSRVTREEAIRAGRALLRTRLERLGLAAAVSRDDGACLFRSAAHWLLGTQERHAEVRAAALAHMRARPGAFRAYFDTPAEWDAYLAGMARPATWGDELCIRAIADAFGAAVHIVTSTEENWLLNYEPEGGAAPGSAAVYLAYVSPVHYDAIGLLQVDLLQ